MPTEGKIIHQENDGELSLKELLLIFKEWVSFLLSKWIIILIFGIIGGALGFLLASSKKPLFIATTTFVLEEEKSVGGIGSLSGLASMAGLDMGGSGGGIFQGDNILELYKSRNMIQKALLSKVEIDGKPTLLIDRYIKFNKLKQIWGDKGIANQINFEIGHKTRIQDSILGTIVADIDKNSLSVTKPNKKLSIIKAEVKSIDEAFSKTFNEQIVKNVNDFYVQTKTKKSLENVAILQQKVDSVRNVMNGSIYRAVVVSDQTPNLNPTRQIQRVAPVQQAQFSAETNKVILGELVKNLELSKISLRKEQPLIQIIDQPVLPLDKDKVSKAKGIVVGGLLSGFFICLFLILRKILKSTLSKA
ncbi:lipopolysaccharide biosynthesis protein [Pedobacter lithocola]|uniref:Lipopolysaccharide biosynthesis protein n=1 Tax=Pedobacter lithocola TaxID=1908239 RepID=A0ABV8P742_9SPHI